MFTSTRTQIYRVRLYLLRITSEVQYNPRYLEESSTYYIRYKVLLLLYTLLSLCSSLNSCAKKNLLSLLYFFNN